MRWWRKVIWRAYLAAARMLRLTGVSRLPFIRNFVFEPLSRIVREVAFTPSNISVANVFGHQMYLGTEATFLSTDFASGSYERATVEVLRRALARGMTVVDVGAHIGYYTLLAAELVGPTGRVYAFEPEPANYEVLAKNIQLNQFHNVVPVRMAVSDTKGSCVLYLSEGISVYHTLVPKINRGKGRIVVDTTTLDDFFLQGSAPGVDLVKIDIEGGEAAALKGMRRLVARSTALKLIVEYNPFCLKKAGVAPQEFLSLLGSLGFTILVISDEGLQPLDAVHARPPKETLNLFCEKTET